MSIFLTLNKVLGVYALILTILGTLLNFFNFFVCMRLRKNTTFVFLSFFSLANAFSLYWWNLNNFLKEFVNIDLLAVSLWTCKIGNYVQFNSLQMAAWFLVLVSLDRVLSTFIQSWKSVYFKSQQAFSVSIFVIVFFLLINSNILWLFGYETTTANGTTVLFCFEVDGYEATRWMTYWGTAHLFLYSVLPFLILAILNIILVSRIYRRKRAASSSQSMRNRYLSSARARRSRRSSDIDGDISNAYRSAVESLGTRNHHHSHQPSLIEKMSKAVVFITVSFIVLTLPIASASSFFAELAKTDAGLFVIVLLDSLSFSYHAFNIFISYTFNTVHREAVNTFFCGDIMRRRKRRRYANSSANQNSYPLHVVRV